MENKTALSNITMLPPTHTSFETAHITQDYPYGFRLRCQRAIWIEHKPKLGYRLVTRTTNPKKAGIVWNAPKAGTYHMAIVLYIDHADEDHVKSEELTSVWDIDRTTAFLDIMGLGLPTDALETVKQHLRALALNQSQRRVLFSRTTKIAPGGVIAETKDQHIIEPTITPERAQEICIKYAPTITPAKPVKPASSPPQTQAALFAI